MQISSSFRSPFRRPQERGAWWVLLGLLAICSGWSLALAHAAQLGPAQLELDSARVRIDAELRVGEPAPAPAADVEAANASLRALQVRARYTPQQQPLTDKTWLAAFALLPLRLRARAQATSGDGAESAPHRAIARSWPLPRSSCSDSDPDADVARRS